MGGETAMITATQMRLDAPLVVLAAAMRLQFTDDPAAQRAIDGAVAYLRADLPREFDGVELRVTSYSRAGEGAVQSTDGESCTCARAHRSWCWHRALFRLLLARMSIREPVWLRVKILLENDCGDPFPTEILFDD